MAWDCTAAAERCLAPVVMPVGQGMNAVVITFALLVAIGLVHYSYVDFRFRHVQGLLWFWLSNPAPALLWVSRGAIGAMVLLALAIPVAGTSEAMAIGLIALFAVHIGTLIMIEIRYGR